MSYKIIIPQSFEKELDKLPELLNKKVVNFLKMISENPFPIGSKKLVNRDGWRVRL